MYYTTKLRGIAYGHMETGDQYMHEFFFFRLSYFKVK